VLTGGLHFPRERQARDRADSGVEEEAIENASLPSRDSGAVAPGGVLVAELLALPATLTKRKRWPFA
jgi:hypothetical protein